MRRITVIVLAAILTLAFMPQASAGWRHHECRYQSWDGSHGFSTAEVKKTIKCAAPRFGVDVDTALAIAYRESHYYQYAENPASGACGIYQDIPRYWPQRISNVIVARPKLRFYDHSCYNARSNIMAAMKMVHDSGWSAWGG